MRCLVISIRIRYLRKKKKKNPVFMFDAKYSDSKIFKRVGIFTPVWKVKKKKKMHNIEKFLYHLFE